LSLDDVMDQCAAWLESSRPEMEIYGDQARALG
jgi:hypothetical protein